MATENKKQSSTPIDIAKEGSLSYRQLQAENAKNYVDPSVTLEKFGFDSFGSSISPAIEYDIEGMERSSLMQQTTQTGNKDYWGNSAFDIQDASTDEYERLSDLRAENQPWYSKLINGVGKAGVLAVTTAAELGGLIYGIGQGAYDAYNAKEGEGVKAFLHGLWYNPLTQAYQNLNELSEEYMPVYYTKDEMENPFSNIFTASFLGDKIIKNLGFMVGAFYGGIPASKLIGKVGINSVKKARNAADALGQGMSKRYKELTAGYSDDLLGKVGEYGKRIRGLSEEESAKVASKYSDDVKDVYNTLLKEGLTSEEKGKKMMEGLDKINKVAKTTRATSQVIGSLGSAINEGAIEAINNSKDWAQLQIAQENDRYAKEIAELNDTYGDSPEGMNEKIKAAKKHETTLALIEEGRAKVGNADLLLNIPILTLSNMFELGKLYTRGFDSTRRQMGSWINDYKLSGSLSKGTLKSDRNWKKGVLNALAKSNAEGMEEYLQKAASDGAGNAVNAAIDRYLRSENSEEAKTDLGEYIIGFGKAIAKNFGDPHAWEEYMIGALSSMIGMPVFGSQTKNAYGPMKDNGVFGFAGGIWGNYQDYMDAKKHETEVAEYLNGRVQDPKFQTYYKNLIKHGYYDKLLMNSLVDGDKMKYKELEFEQLFEDINAAASAGHLGEFMELINYNHDYSDDELLDILKTTTSIVSAEDQIKRDTQRASWLDAQLTNPKEIDDRLEEINTRLTDISLELGEENTTPTDEEMLNAEYENLTEEKENLEVLKNKREASDYSEEDIKEFKKERETLRNKLLKPDEYKDKEEGPFINANGEMTLTEEGKEEARSILERNKEELNQAIQDYLKIRNDIDIETDGRLTDTQINLLTQMRAKILNYDRRSAEMAEDLITGLGDIKKVQEKSRKLIEKDKKEAQEAYDAALEHWNKVKDGKNSAQHKKNVEDKLNAAKQKLETTEKAKKYNEDILSLLDLLTEQKEATSGEAKAERKGYGQNRRRRLAGIFSPSMRNINSDEAQAILTNPKNFRTLLKTIESTVSDVNTKQKLIMEAVDLYALGVEKAAYRAKVREFIGDPSKINEVAQQATDKLTEEEINNKADELALSIQKAKNMEELDTLIRGAQATDRRILKAALEKAKKNSNETGKKFIDDYEKANNFFREFIKHVNTVSYDIRDHIILTAEQAWQHSLTTPNVYGTFISKLQEASEAMRASNTDLGVEQADAIDKILKDLDAAKKSSATKTSKDVKKGTDNNPKKEKAPEKNDDQKKVEEEAMAAIARNASKQAKEEEKNKPSEDTIDILKDAIREELKEEYKSSIDELSKALQKRIEKFHEDGSHPRITDTDVKKIAQALADEDITRDGNIGEDRGEDFFDSEETTRSEEMSINVAQNFSSDYVTQYELGKIPIDYRESFDPHSLDTVKNPAQQDSVRKFLIDKKAYDFVDRNYLGYIYQAAMESSKSELPIYFLKSTNDDVNPKSSNDVPVIFLAIKVDKEVKKAVRKGAFNNNPKADLSEVFKETVKIGDDEYQIVGVLTIKKNATEDVSTAFNNLQTAIYQDLKDKIAEAKEGGQEFVVWDKHSKVDTIHTGRLEKRNDEHDNNNKVSLYDFVATSQGSDKRHSSSEWDNNAPFTFGIVINSSMSSNVPNDFVSPNDKLMARNNGAIMLFVPKPDGRMYPVRCTRRTVGEWLNKTADGEHTGEQLLSDVLNSEIPNDRKNKFIQNIVKHLETLFNDNSSFAQKMNAKAQLAKYFVFGAHSPINVDEINDEISLRFGSNKEVIDGNTIEDKIVKFFNILSANDIQFSLPNPASEEGKKSKGRDIITSGVFEVGLRGFYNFKANFTITPITPDGTYLTPTQTPEGLGNEPNIREGERTFTINGKKKTYYVEKDPTTLEITNIYDSEHKPVEDTQELNTIALIITANEKRDPSNAVSTRLVDSQYTKKGAIKEVQDAVKGYLKEFDGVFYIDTDDGVQWVLDTRNPGTTAGRVYSLGSKEDKEYNHGKGLEASVQEKLNEYRSNPSIGFKNLGASAIQKTADDNGPKSASDIVDTTSTIHTTSTTSRTQSAPSSSSDSGTTLLSGKVWSKVKKTDAGLLGFLRTNSNPVVFKKLQALEDAGVTLDPKKIEEAVKNKTIFELIDDLKGCGAGKL